MVSDPIQALRAAARPAAAAPARPSLLVAGATGALGNEVVRRLAGSAAFGPAFVLAREPIRDGLRDVRTLLVPQGPLAGWPLCPAAIGLVMFDPPRLFYQRERALWTPEPAQLAEVALWMRRCGVTTLAVVLPHAQGRLPEALKRGLASLDEQAVAALGFERLIIVRSARKPGAAPAGHLGLRLAAFMLSVLRFMVPSSEQPVRAASVAELVAVALQLAPPGIHIAAPELVWRAGQGQLREVAVQWLSG